MSRTEDRPDPHLDLHAPPVSGLIGPNAVTRLAEAIASWCGEAECRRIFSAAGLAGHLDSPPVAMVAETDVERLHAALHAACTPFQASMISTEAGRLTAEYLLANRIPQGAQRMLRFLPRPFAARILISAIARHAWTFAGGGTFDYRFAPGLVLTLKGAPVARGIKTTCPACSYYSATFEHIFAAMLGPQVRVSEFTCEACGDDACRFAVSY